MDFTSKMRRSRTAATSFQPGRPEIVAFLTFLPHHDAKKSRSTTLPCSDEASNGLPSTVVSASFGSGRLTRLLSADALRSSSRKRPFSESVRAVLVVLPDPGLDGSDAALEGQGDRGCALALGGEDNGLVALPESLGRDRPGETLEFFQGEMIRDTHRRAPGVGR